MHVDWAWIRQRPHFLAAELARHHTVIVFSPKSFHPRKNLVSNPCPPRLRLRRILRWPMLFYSLPFVPHLLAFVNRLLAYPDLRRADCLWVTHPLLYQAFVTEPVLPGRKVIYDCMDDYESFPNVRKYPAVGRLIRRLERDLLRRADIVFCSSETLRRRLLSRHPEAADKNRIIVLNNGVASSLARLPSSKGARAAPPKDAVHLVYVGTISEWLDFPLLTRTLNRWTDVVFDLYGPVTPGLDVPHHDRLRFHGVVDHERLPSIMASADALVMPFRLDDLILGVDPVKLYEYITAGKPVIAIRYPETERFQRFVHLYADGKEFLDLVGSLRRARLKPKQSTEKVRRFLSDNTWSRRAEVVLKALESVGH